MTLLKEFKDAKILVILKIDKENIYYKVNKILF